MVFISLNLWHRLCHSPHIARGLLMLGMTGLWNILSWKGLKSRMVSVHSAGTVSLRITELFSAGCVGILADAGREHSVFLPAWNLPCRSCFFCLHFHPNISQKDKQRAGEFQYKQTPFRYLFFFLSGSPFCKLLWFNNVAPSCSFLVWSFP